MNKFGDFMAWHWQGKIKWRNFSPVATQFPTNPTWTGKKLNTDLYVRARR